MSTAAKVIDKALERIDDLPDLAREPARAALAELRGAAEALDVLGVVALKTARDVVSLSDGERARIELSVAGLDYDQRRRLVHATAGAALAEREMRERAADEVLDAVKRAGLAGLRAAWPILLAAL
jgi:hypothetical protein